MVSEATRKHGLQVEEDRPWQEKFWTAQRVGWLLMAVLVVAALLGATGKGGPLASASVKADGGVLNYPRITRWQSNEQLVARLPASASGEVGIELSRPFVELFSIESIEPEPSEVEATAAGHRFTFELGAGKGEKLIVFNVRVAKPALQRSVGVRIGEGSPQQMRLTVLP